jgi:hypothetical protein
MAIANGVEPVQDGRIFIELLTGLCLFEVKGSPAEHGATLKLSIDRGWLWPHENGTYVKPTQAEPICSARTFALSTVCEG